MADSGWLINTNQMIDDIVGKVLTPDVCMNLGPITCTRLHDLITSETLLIIGRHIHVLYHIIDVYMTLMIFIYILHDPHGNVKNTLWIMVMISIGFYMTVIAWIIVTLTFPK